MNTLKKYSLSALAILLQAGGVHAQSNPLPPAANKAPVEARNGVSHGFLGASEFRAQEGVIAVLENFVFDAKFIVTSFEFSYVSRKKEFIGPFIVKGPYFAGNPEVAAYQKNAAVP